MNSKFIIIASILVVGLGVFALALTHSKNVATSGTPTTVVPDTATPGAPSDMSQTSSTTSVTVTSVTSVTQPTQKPAPARTAVAVTIKNYMFAPQTITVKKGTTVTWTNTDIAKHTVTSDDGSGPSSQFFGQGESYAYTFTKTGTYTYHCEPHPYMKATVVVTE